MTSYEHLPDDLPVPIDDGATDHLVGTTVPPVGLRATTGEVFSLDRVSGRTVLFIYPRTGIPGQPSPTGWDAIPGARGCTPQNCAIRDAYDHFTALGARVFGLSSQTTADQLEAAQRLHLPYPLLSDSDLTLATAWQLPTFSVDGLTLIRRITIFLMNGAVDGVIYPVFPADRSAETALSWLRAQLGSGSSGRPKMRPRRGLPHPIPRPPVR